MKAKDDLKNVADIVPEGISIKFTEKEIYDGEGNVVGVKPALTFIIMAHVVDADGNRIARYEIPSYSEIIELDELKEKHSKMFAAIEQIKEYLLAKIKAREGL